DLERTDWRRGYAAARRYRQRTGNLLVPYGFTDPQTQYPLGRWIHDQRTAYAAGTMTGLRVRRLEALGMVWSAEELAWEENLAALAAYADQHGTLAAPRDATALGKQIGVLLSNLRREGGLGKDPERAARRAAQLAALDPDWRPAWPIDWQRHYAMLRQCLDGGATLAEVLPGVTVGGVDVGRWLERQRQPAVWTKLQPGQRERLQQLGVQPVPGQQTADGATAANGGKGSAASGGKGRTSGTDAFQRGVQALRRFRDREGHTRVPRGHTETWTTNGNGDEGGGGQEVTVRLGIWRSNTRTRRQHLTPEQFHLLDRLGLFD
ncbi:helicase associated domain-containing protein, partial [Streptomyces capparidis]